MGVPKFYRWISERYPKINDIVSDSALLPEFDHLYLDMNGIIHGCTHPSDRDISDVISERDMMLGIMHYLDRIITQIVKPKVSVYMAIDGVAPRAKLNQQRSRRFRSAKDMEEATKDMPTDDNNEKKQVFDSNCITPGTEFLAKVSECIKYFIRKKIKEDPLWHNLKVVFSGHDVPGEGEHKIMQHIRDMKAQPNYQPNTRHCMYGQDADLIMLGLVTHEPHFTILREVIDFNFARNNNNALKAVKKFTKESDFQLLHLSVLREYLRMEFCHEAPEVDLEHVIDDFVFMTFLVGNDFLPHMPSLDIGDGAFDLLFGLYKNQRGSWGSGQYLTEAGNISDAARLEVFIAAIGAEETAILEKREENDAEYTKKRRKWDKRDGKAEGPTDEQIANDEAQKQGDYLSMIETMIATAGSDAKFVDGWKPVTNPGQKDFKGRYYWEKMQMKPIDIDEHLALRKAYMEGLIWCLAYYYKGCISWGWFYPYHYGPMLSDLMNLPKIFEQIKFDLGQPLTPFQQLMGCLPPASAILVPPLYRKLMIEPDSPIIQFYPTDFKVDMNGKRNPWEGVNILPFIDADLLKSTIAEQCKDELLSPIERKRNSLGHNYCYTYDLTCMETVPSANPQIGLPDIVHCSSSVSTFQEPLESSTTFEPKLLEGTQIPYPGFPSLNVLPISSYELVEIKLNCFGSASKYPTMLIKLHEMPELPPLEALAPNVLGKSVFVNWPMMHEAKVVAISNETGEIRMGNNQKPKARTFNKVEADRWTADSQFMFERYFIGNGIPGAGGVQIGPITLRLKVLPLQGMKTNMTNGATKKLFGTTEADIPMQLALWQAPAPDPRFIERGPMTLQDRYPVNCKVVLTKGKHRGCSGVVVGVVDKKTVGVKVQVIPPELPFGLAIAQSVNESVLSSVDASRILKLHPGLFGKITGSLLFEPGRYDLGLNLKSAEGMCVVGYTRKKPGKPNGNSTTAWNAGDSVLVVGSEKAESEEQERVIWEYTPKAIRLVNAYRQKFPQLFNAISKQPNERKYDATKAFGPNGEAWLPVVREWLNNIETAKMPRTPVSTDSVSPDAIAAIERAAEVRSLALKKRGYPQETMLKVPGSALYKEGSIGATDVLQASDYNRNEAPELGDRIVNFCAMGIPFGARGTVIGIHEAATTGCVEVVMDEEFIGGTTLQGSCSNFRGKLCAWAHLLKVTPENSKTLVNKLVPKQAGAGGYDKIIASVEDDSLGGKGGVPAGNGAEPAAAPAQNGTPVPQQGKPNNRPASRQAARTGSSGRAGSSARTKQGAWKEARGPSAKGGAGFKGPGKRGPSTGLARWKNVISNNKKATKQQASKPKAAGEKSAGEKTQELKAMLGFGASPAPPVAQASAATASTAADLKALLGVGSSTGSEGLSLDQIPDPPMPPPEMMAQQQQQPQQPATAADKLFAMLKSKQPQMPQGGPMYPPPPQASSFNFTYVEEGKGAPPPMPAASMPSPHQQMPPQMMMQYNPVHMQYPPNNFSYGYPPPPPAHMMPPPPAHMHSPPPPPPAAGPSEVDFPPLGATAPPAKKEKPAVVEEKKSAPSPKPAKAATMVPAVIASKSKK